MQAFIIRAVKIRPSRIAPLSRTGYGEAMSPWISTDSDIITSFRYDEKAHAIRVLFQSGDMSDYYEASPGLFAQFVESSSKSGFFAAYIRDWLPCRPVSQSS